MKNKGIQALERNPYLTTIHETLLKFYRTELRDGTATATHRELLKSHLMAFSTFNVVDEVWDPDHPQCYEVSELDLPQKPKKGVSSPRARSPSPFSNGAKSNPDAYNDLQVCFT